MADTKSFASLSSGLLARKGGAKPAMRPQGFGSFGGSLEDLGWNDMGTPEYHDHVPTPIDGLTPLGGRTAAVPVNEPAVVEQQRELEAHFAQPAPAPVAVVPQMADVVELPRVPESRSAGKAKAAFTLRLDPDRHFKLRLACALDRRSAQQLVTEALDRYLNSLPDLEALATRVAGQAGKRSR
jgi:hypothetical protein